MPEKPTVTATTLDTRDHTLIQDRVQEIDAILELEGWPAIQVMYGWNPDTGLELRVVRLEEDHREVEYTVTTTLYEAKRGEIE